MSSRVLVTATRVAVSQASPGADLRPTGCPVRTGSPHPLGVHLNSTQSASTEPAPCALPIPRLAFSTTWRAGPSRPPFSGGGNQGAERKGVVPRARAGRSPTWDLRCHLSDTRLCHQLDLVWRVGRGPTGPQREKGVAGAQAKGGPGCRTPSSSRPGSKRPTPSPVNE